MSEIKACGSPQEQEEAVAAAAEVVARGECVVLPTDTVYGIGCDAFSAPGVQTLLGAKGRTREMPPPVLIARPSVVDALADEVSPEARALAEAFWPGALTIVCWAQPTLGWDLGETHGTVALRVPDDDVARAVLGKVGPMAVSSANRTGMPAARTAQAAREMLQDRVPLYLDDGVRPVADAAQGARDVASTIVDCTGETPVVLRHGAITLERLREVVPAVHGGAQEDAPSPGTARDTPVNGAADASEEATSHGTPARTTDSDSHDAAPGQSAAQDASRDGGSQHGPEVPGEVAGPDDAAGTAAVSDEDVIASMVADAAPAGTHAVDQLRDRSRSSEPRWGGTSALSMDEARDLVAGPDGQD